MGFLRRDRGEDRQADQQRGSNELLHSTRWGGVTELFAVVETAQCYKTYWRPGREEVTDVIHSVSPFLSRKRQGWLVSVSFRFLRQISHVGQSSMCSKSFVRISDLLDKKGNHFLRWCGGVVQQHNSFGRFYLYSHSRPTPKTTRTRTGTSKEPFPCLRSR